MARSTKTTTKPAIVARPVRTHEEQMADAQNYLVKEFEQMRQEPMNLRGSFAVALAADPTGYRLTWESHKLIEASIIGRMVATIDYRITKTEENETPDALHAAILATVADLREQLVNGHNYGGVDFDCQSTCPVARAMSDLGRKAAREILQGYGCSAVSMAQQVDRMIRRHALTAAAAAI